MILRKSQIMNIPQGYKQTELGIIPEDWEVTTIKQIADITTGNKNTQDAEEGGKYPFYVRSQNVERINSYSYDCEGIVTAGDGVGTGKIFHYVRGKFGLHQRAYLIYNFKDFDSQYFYWYFSQYFYDRINQMTAKSSVDSVRKEMIEDMCILRAPIAEQRAIAEALSDVDGLIAALDKKIAKKRLLKQGAMQQLLTGKKRLPGFTDEWIDRSLSQLGSFISGNGFPIYFQGNKSGKYPFFKVSDFNNRGNERCLMHSNNYISESTKERLNCNIVPASSVIFAKIGAAIFLERKRLSTKECCIDNNMMAFSPNEYIDANYICFLLQTISFGELVEATALPSLGAKILGSIILKVPNTLNEQQAIATILSDMDKEIADLEAQRDKYRLLKSGMMQKLLTGQIRLVKQQAKIVLLGVDVPAVREIPVAAHIIAGHIVNRSHQSRGWGRTKLQKSLHLIGYCMQLNLGNEYIRNTAGPDDQQLMNYIDQKFRQYRHVNKVSEKLPDGKTHYSYTPTPMIQDVEMAYEKYPKELREQVDALIDKLNTMDLAGAEILSTLYAVWNNRIIKQDQITDDLLIADFYAWSTHKADFEEARVRKALNYMRDNNIIPVGWGKYIDKRKA